MDWTKNKTWQDLNSRMDISQAVLRKAEQDIRDMDLKKPTKHMNHIERQIKNSPHDGAAAAPLIAKRYGISQKQAGALWNIFHSKATFQINSERQLKIGIRKGTWIFVNAGRYPCAHKELNNVQFDITLGVDFFGEKIFPGCEPGCMCGYSPIIPDTGNARDQSKPSGIISWMKSLFSR